MLSDLKEIAVHKPHLFEEELWDWFWQQFDELGGCGLFVNDRRLVDDDNTIMEEHLARMVFEAFPCAPFQIALFDKLYASPGGYSYEELVALTITAVDYHVSVGTMAGSTTMWVDYTWPEAHSEASEDGKTGSGGSHKTKRYTFDLAAPESLDAIRQCVWWHCKIMIEQLKPKSDMVPEVQHMLF